MILPVISVAAGILVSFLVMLPVAKASTVSIVAPNLMMSVSIAMSVDYSLFLLSRYREEMKLGVPPRTAIPIVLNTAGRTVAVSALTLIACCLALLIMPLDLLRSLGIGSSVSVFVTMAINLTLSPALLVTFEGFFSRALYPCPCGTPCSRRNGGARKNAHGSSALVNVYEGVRMAASSEPGEEPSEDEDVPMLTYSASAGEGEDGPGADRDGGSELSDVQTARQSRWYGFGRRVGGGPHGHTET